MSETAVFWDYLFDNDQGVEGNVFFNLFQNGQPIRQLWAKWPRDRDKLTSVATHYAEDFDVYFSPALYSSRQPRRTAVRGTFVTWADVDSPAGQDVPAGLRVESGSPGHAHVYWRADRLLQAEQAEDWNYSRVDELGADKGGWDAIQLLRVPGTLNHKTTPGRPVKLHVLNKDLVVPFPGSFRVRAPRYNKPDILPNLDSVMGAHELPQSAVELLSLSTTTDRSGKLYKLARILEESGFTRDETYVILDSKDRDWGKFTGRHDRENRLSQLVAAAYENSFHLVDDSETPTATPTKPKADPYEPFQPLGWGLRHEGRAPKEWLVEDRLSATGYMVLGGPTGVGKSQIALNLAANLVLGSKKWLGQPIIATTEQRVLYVSLEMDTDDVKKTTDLMSSALPVPAIEKLQQNLHVLATVRNFFLDEQIPKRIKGQQFVPTAREILLEWIKRTGPYTGLILDTLGASTSESLTDESSVRHTMNWLKEEIRGVLGMWMVLLVHPRKANGQVKRTELTTDDLYGSRVIGDEADAIFLLNPVKGDDDLIVVGDGKARFRKRTHDLRIRRGSNLWFSVTDDKPPIVSRSGKVREQREDFTLEDDDFGDEDDL